MSLLVTTGELVSFLLTILGKSLLKPHQMNSVLRQIIEITWTSALITILAGLFVGALMSIQFTLQLEKFGALAYLGGLSASGTLREIGPLLIAFMLSGKIGAATAAEIGSMRVTDQLDAMECLGADSIDEVVVPRFWGIIGSSFLLLVFGLVASLAGGLILGHLFANISFAEYVRYIPTIIKWDSVVSSMVKCLLFAMHLALSSTYFGFYCQRGSYGVGEAIVKAAVTTMLGIVFWDWWSSELFSILRPH